MPRDIVLGNGELLVNLDHYLNIRDIYYPYVGWANHVGGHLCRVGVWVASSGFAWLDESWEWQIKYLENTLVTSCSARHRQLGIRLTASHTVLHDKNILLIRYQLQNLMDEPREARLFLAHDLRIDESDIGDTCCYYPLGDCMIHYKRDRYFLFGGVVGEDLNDKKSRLDQYACGEKGFRGAEGTWRDAEDGLLSMNAIAQGAVDSVHSFPMPLPPSGTVTAQAWMIAGKTMQDVLEQQDALETRTFDSAFRDTEHYWCQIMRELPTAHNDLPPRVAELFSRSLLIIRTQADKRGAILASNDSDIMETARAHYSYMWPRDGALVSLALDRVRMRGVSLPFFEFCARVLPSDRAALMHKYGPDGTVGASWHPWIVDGAPETPFQEDGTALVIYALWKHVQIYSDKTFATQMYNKFVRPAADFLSEFRYADTGLPLPSWDVWEERHGTHVWTTAAVCAALNSASEYAAYMGDIAAADRFQIASSEVREAISKHFWNEKEKMFARMVTLDEARGLKQDMTADSSVIALFTLGVFPADDARLRATMQVVGQKLWVKVGVGGLARYERDYYFRVTDDFARVPGNPWIICTLWLADWYIATAKRKEDLKSALDLLEWASICALRTGVLSEQVQPFTLQQLSVAPLTWSHAQYVITATDYLEKLAELKKAEKSAAG